MTAPAEFVSVTKRYGLRSHLQAWGRDHFIARHSGTGYGGWGNCERDAKLRCACPGVGKRCCDTASQEDMMCDACREYCYVAGVSGARHRPIDLYGVATSMADTTARFDPSAKDAE